MLYIKTICDFCNKSFLKNSKRYNESIKNEWKLYCSKHCRLAARITRIILQCDNPLCNQSFERLQNQVAKFNNHFCSQSCAAKINNAKRPKVEKCCPECKRVFIGRRKYCSSLCVIAVTKRALYVRRETIIKEIQTFYKRLKRIPFKREYNHYKAARNRFGTWNKAIETAGFPPNPVIFSHKHVAKDGHICDSLSEKIIDDFLYRNNITHTIHVPYGKYKMSADFKVGDTLLEFTGLAGQLKAYDKLLERKRAFWKEYELKVIEIHPTDLFPVNKLPTILTELV